MGHDDHSSRNLACSQPFCCELLGPLLGTPARDAAWVAVCLWTSSDFAMSNRMDSMYRAGVVPSCSRNSLVRPGRTIVRITED
ncbi:hypothetical protein [Streptomyces gilvus]|uniref:hypothetical protein n=1 Tax=Streptomyces gilvus TaxID=2920937 RepID=UPI0035A89328